MATSLSRYLDVYMCITLSGTGVLESDQLVPISVYVAMAITKLTQQQFKAAAITTKAFISVSWSSLYVCLSVCLSASLTPICL